MKDELLAREQMKLEGADFYLKEHSAGFHERPIQVKMSSVCPECFRKVKERKEKRRTDNLGRLGQGEKYSNITRNPELE